MRALLGEEQRFQIYSQIYSVIASDNQCLLRFEVVILFY